MSNRRRWIIASSNSVILRPRRYVTIYIRGTNSTQYYDGTTKIFIGNPTIGLSNQYTGFEVSVINNKTIEESLPGTYTFIYTESDFNVTYPDDGYDYYVDWDIVNNGTAKIIDPNTVKNYYDNDIVYIDDVRVSGKTSLNSSEYSGNYLMHRLYSSYGYSADNSNLDYPAGTLLRIDFAQGRNATTFSNLKLYFNDDPSVGRSVFQSIHDGYVNPVCLMQTYSSNSSYIRGIESIYNGGSLYMTSGTNASLLFKLTELSSLKRIDVTRDSQATSADSFKVASLGVVNFELNWVNPYHKLNKTSHAYDNILVNGQLLTYNNWFDLLYGNVYQRAMPEFPTNTIADVSEYPTYGEIKSIYIYISFLVKKDSTVTFNSFKLYFNNTLFSLNECIDYGYIEPIVVVQEGPDNSGNYKGWWIIPSGFFNDSSSTIHGASANKNCIAKVYFTTTGKAAFNGCLLDTSSTTNNTSIYVTNKENYNIEYYNMPEGCTAEYTFDSRYRYDTSGNGNSLGSGKFNYVEGILGKFAATFGERTDLCTSIGNLPELPITLSWWIQYADSQPESMEVCFNIYNMLCKLETDGKLYILGNEVDSFVSNGIHHFAITVDSSKTTKIYKDGVLISTTTQNDISSSVSSNYLLSNAKNNYWTSKFDQFRVFNRVLSDNEVLYLYQEKDFLEGNI